MRARGRTGGPRAERLRGDPVGPGSFTPTASPVIESASELLRCRRDLGVDGDGNLAEQGLGAIHCHAEPS